jgi:hypothetical protein
VITEESLPRGLSNSNLFVMLSDACLLMARITPINLPGGCREPYVDGDAGNRMIVGMQGTVRSWGCRVQYIGGYAGNCT